MPKCTGLGHFDNDCPSPKDIKKFMQATWSDIDSKESGFITSKEEGYDPNDLLAFIASVESMHDSDSDDEFINDQKIEIFLIILSLIMKN